MNSTNERSLVQGHETSLWVKENIEDISSELDNEGLKVAFLGKTQGFAYGRSVYFCVDFLEVGTINATRNCDTLSKLNEAIRKRRPGLLRSGVMLVDDNARPHSATATQNHIVTLGWKCRHHPPYNPNLAPSDFHLFPALKKNLT
ncbi:histone-lysine N-methyltransferase SETMAR [Trichonephila clavipes]|nr:histone-lysine N-methyltransferase SETMAR [Trichonephila clavipes]